MSRDASRVSIASLTSGASKNSKNKQNILQHQNTTSKKERMIEYNSRSMRRQMKKVTKMGEKLGVNFEDQEFQASEQDLIEIYG